MSNKRKHKPELLSKVETKGSAAEEDDVSGGGGGDIVYHGERRCEHKSCTNGALFRHW